MVSKQRVPWHFLGVKIVMNEKTNRGMDRRTDGRTDRGKEGGRKEGRVRGMDGWINELTWGED